MDAELFMTYVKELYDKTAYNTMSKEKKAKVETEGLGRLMGIYSYVNGGVLILMGVLHALGLKPVLTPAILVSLS